MSAYRQASHTVAQSDLDAQVDVPAHRDARAHVLHRVADARR